MRRGLLVQVLLLPALAFGQTDQSVPDLTGPHQNLSDLMRARNYAMGGAYRAIALGGEAITGSPAALALRRKRPRGGPLEQQRADAGAPPPADARKTRY